MKKTRKIIAVAISAIMAVSTLALPLSAQAVTDTADSTATATEKAASDFSWDNASVYFLLTDRFKNGNTSNDHSYNRGLNADGTVATDYTTDVAMFHGGDFAGITQTIKDGYFNDLGINALWISAPYEQSHGYAVGDTKGESDSKKSFPHYAYHGYYVLDYSETDANFGTPEEFQTMVDTAHEYGLRIVLDVVMNHSGYNNMYDMNEYGYGTLKSGWESVYYDWANITNPTYHAKINYNSTLASWANWWGSDWVRAGIVGYTPGGSDNLTTCLDYLPDFKTESETAVDIPALLKTKWTKEGVLKEKTDELNQWFEETGNPRTTRYYQVYWLSQWVRDYGVDGFRCDTAKHVELESWKALKTECVKALKEWKAENKDKALDDTEFWMVGENWDTTQTLNYNDYFTEGGFDSMINFAYGGGKGLPNVTNINATYQKYADFINTKEDCNFLTYISSHDDKLCRTDLIYQGSALMLMPGQIQVFYGDETNRPVQKVSVNGKNYTIGDHAFRSDMNWDAIDTTVEDHWQTVGTFRNNHIAVGAGSNTAVDTTNGTAFIRQYDKDGVQDTVAACLAADANTDVTIHLGSAFDEGSLVKNAYNGSVAKVTDGTVTFNSGANKTILIEAYDGTELTGIIGDVNMDNTINMLDVILIQQHLAKIISLTDYNFTLADTNKDNKITLVDYVLIQRYISKLPNTPNVGDTIKLI